MQTELDLNINNSTGKIFHECAAVKTISICLKIISSIMMFYFASHKIMAMPVSVQGFTQFGEVLNINGIGFMYFTGYTEFIIGLLLFISIFLRNRIHRDRVALVGYTLLSATMIGAILTELYIRTNPINFLIELAVAFLLISLIHSSFIIKKLFFEID